MLAIFSLHQAAPKGLLFVQEGPDGLWFLAKSRHRAVTEPSLRWGIPGLNSLLNLKLIHSKRLLFVKKLTPRKASSD